MNLNFLKRFFFLSCLVVVAIGYFIYLQWPDNYTHVIFCDVGQADATLITHGFVQVLVDGGRNEVALSCLGEHMPFWDRTLEAIVVTHADEDHIGGLATIMERYRSRLIFSTKFGKDTETFFKLRSAVLNELEHGAELKEPILGQQIRITQDTSLRILPPSYLDLSPEVAGGMIKNAFDPNLSENTLLDVAEGHQEIVKSYNDLSIALFIEVKKVKMLLTGDLEQLGEQALLDKGLITKTSILKVGHHGSNSSTIQAFLETVRPEISIVSSGKNNKFGHPHSEILQRLDQIGSKIYRTDQKGSIEVVTDGKSYWLAK